MRSTLGCRCAVLWTATVTALVLVSMTGVARAALPAVAVSVAPRP